MVFEVMVVTGYKLKAERGIGYQTTKGFLAKSGLITRSKVYSGGCSHVGYSRGR